MVKYLHFKLSQINTPASGYITQLLWGCMISVKEFRNCSSHDYPRYFRFLWSHYSVITAYYQVFESSIVSLQRQNGLQRTKKYPFSIPAFADGLMLKKVIGSIQ